MNTQVKGAIKSGIISGVIYAGLMEQLFGWFNQDEVNHIN